MLQGTWWKWHWVRLSLNRLCPAHLARMMLGGGWYRGWFKGIIGQSFHQLWVWLNWLTWLAWWLLNGGRLFQCSCTVYNVQCTPLHTLLGPSWSLSQLKLRAWLNWLTWLLELDRGWRSIGEEERAPPPTWPLQEKKGNLFLQQIATPLCSIF